MSLGKLWIRVRGELLNLKEDIILREDLGEKAAALLTKLEGLAAAPLTAAHKDKDGGLEDRARNIAQRIPSLSPAEKADARSHQELMETVDELTALNGAGAVGVSTDDDSLEPNPRRLG